MQNKDGQTFDIRVEEVHSGDDIVMMVNLGIDNLFKRVRARLAGVDCPDAYRASPETDAGRIRDRVREITRGDCRVIVHQQGGRGGWLITLLFKDTTQAWVNLNELLISEGYVYTAHIQKRA